MTTPARNTAASGNSLGQYLVFDLVLRPLVGVVATLTVWTMIAVVYPFSLYRRLVAWKRRKAAQALPAIEEKPSVAVSQIALVPDKLHLVHSNEEMEPVRATVLKMPAAMSR